MSEKPKIEKIESDHTAKASVKIEDFKKRLKQSLEKNGGGEELPPLSIDIFYSIHHTGEDIKGMAGNFKKADVYIPESLAWSPDVLDIFRNVSDGILNPEEALKELEIDNSDYRSQLLKERFNIIYNSNKPITFIDVPDNDPLARELDKYIDFKINFDLSFEETLDNLKDFLKNHDRVQKEREKYMTSNLNSRIKELLEDYPELKNKDELKILLTIGGLHSLLYFDFRKTGQKVGRKFSKSLFIFSFQEEGFRRERFGKAIDEEFIAKVLLEKVFNDFFWRFFKNVTGDTLKINTFVRMIVSRFNSNEIRQIYDQIKKAKDGKELIGVFIKWFKEKNIKLPTSEKELDNFLK